MLTWRFAVQLNRSLVELVGLVIEKTKSFPCVIVKKTFHVIFGVASFQIQKMKLILFRRVPVSQRIWTPPGPNPLADMDPPSQIWTPPTKLSF